MKGTVVLITKDQNLKVFENIHPDEYKKMKKQDQQLKKKSPMITGKKLIWCDRSIDWEYGY